MTGDRGISRPALRRPARLGIDLATPEPIPREGIERAVELMRSGHLFRYGEAGGETSEVSLWESEFAAAVGRTYAVAVNSCGAAIYLALHCLGVKPEDTVLLNAWTLAPVPGAVAHLGARAVLLETTPDLVVDLDHLETQAAAHPGSVLLLSHMRGHVADMERIVEIVATHRLRLVEDCAHSLGASWAGRATGTYGDVGCFSTQTYKHLNSGEGGVVVTDDPEVAARAILASGSYMLFAQHESRPGTDLLERLAPNEANHSMRLTTVAAAVLRPQLRDLPRRVQEWNERYSVISQGLADLPVRLPERPAREQFVGSSIQFFLDELSPAQIAHFCREADELGVHIKWFGASQADGFTSAYKHWAYARRSPLPLTDRVLTALCDMRIPLALPLTECRDLVAIIGYALSSATSRTDRSDL